MLIIEFFKRFLPVVIFFAAAAGLLHITRDNAREERITARETWRVKVHTAMFEAGFSGGVKDVAFLAEMVRDFPTRNPDALGRIFRGYLDKHRNYDQVRFLDESGLERVRVNKAEHGARIVPPEQLQDKSGRGYFQTAADLKPGTVYISPLNLNREHGLVEMPLKPVIRYAAPVTDIHGNLMGVVVLNHLAAELLEPLRTQNRAPEGKLLLVNDAGHWLVGPTPQDEWGFEFADLENTSLAQRPQVYHAVQLHSQGTVHAPDGLYIFSGIDIARKMAEFDMGDTRIVGSGSLTVVSYTPEEMLHIPLWNEVNWLTAMLIFLSAFPAYMVSDAKLKRLRAESELRDNEEKLNAMSRASHDALVMVDDHGRIIFWNKAAEELFGWTEEEAHGKEVHELIAPVEYHDQVQEGLEHFARTGQGVAVGNLMEFDAVKRDGTLFPIERALAAFRLNDRWYAVAGIRDITDRKESERKLEYMAHTDPLTDLCNRRSFLQGLHGEIHRSSKTDKTLAMVMFDADFFKKVNDTYGHDVGDEVLIMLARTAKETFRETDMIARLGGEEFAVLMPDATRDKALSAAERFREVIESKHIQTDAGPVQITVSQGVTVLQPHDDAEKLLKRADTALYEAKQTGRNKTVFQA